MQIKLKSINKEPHIGIFNTRDINFHINTVTLAL